MMDLFEWYGGLPPWSRMLVALFFLILGLLCLFVFGLGFRLSITPLVIGFVLFWFAFPSDSERRGYHD